MSPAARRALLACALLAFSALAFCDSTLTEQDKARVIDGAFARFHETYIFPDDIAKIEATIRDKARRGEYRDAVTPEAFATQLEGDLRKLANDPHIRVIYYPGETPRFPTKMGERPPETDADRAARLNFEAARFNNGFARVQHLEGNVGVLELIALPDGENMVEKAAAAMTFLKDTSALILDLRANRGGEITGVDVILSYFVEGRVHTYDMLAKKPEDNIQYFTDAKVSGPRYAADKAVFVLTSARTFSAGEALVDAMRTWRHAPIVGERTRGGSNVALPTKATEHFVVGVPFMKTVNVATGKNWNGVGIEPDVAAPADKAQDVAHVLALEAIVATTKNSAQREQTQALLQQLKAKP